MIRTYNILLHPTQEIYDAWLDLLTNATNAYNDCARFIKENNVKLDIKIVHEAVYHMLREKHPMLPAQSIVKTYKDVISAFRSIRKNKAEHKADTPHKKNPSIRLDKRLYNNLTKEGIYVSGVIKGKRQYIPFELYPQVEYMFDNYPLHDPIIFAKDGNLYISLPFECPEKAVVGNDVTGVDLGIKRLFTTSEGVAFKDKTYLTRRRQIRFIKNKLRSKGTKSAKKHLQKIRKKEMNLSKDMLHRATNALLEHSGTHIVLEDLSGLKKNTSKTANGYKRKRHNNMIGQVPFAKFKEILDYKAPLHGKDVATVNPSDTSRKDSRTGMKDGVRKGCRYYCKDGTVLDADWNAAINIGNRQKKHPFTNETPPLDGGLKMFLDGRAQSIAQSHVSPATALQATKSLV